MLSKSIFDAGELIGYKMLQIKENVMEIRSYETGRPTGPRLWFVLLFICIALVLICT